MSVSARVRARVRRGFSLSSVTRPTYGSDTLGRRVRVRVGMGVRVRVRVRLKVRHRVGSG